MKGTRHSRVGFSLFCISLAFTAVAVEIPITSAVKARSLIFSNTSTTASPEEVPKHGAEDRGVMSADFSTLTHVSPALTNDKLNKALSDWFKQSYTFTHWEYVSNTGKGDSYVSEVMRIRIYGVDKNNDTKHVQVILKNIPKSVARRLTFRTQEFTKNEINFYEKVLPALLKFQATKNVADPFDKFAKVFLSYSDGTNDVICLEDASLENFRSTVRQRGIDLEHCKLTFKVLAQFHALSFAMKDQEPEEFKEIRTQVFETYYHDRLRGWYSRFWKRISGIAIDAVEKTYPDSIYVEKVKQFAVPERYQDMIDAVTNTFETGVISHGDPWTSNFLYKYKDVRPIDAKIIDFQLSRCASPVLDLVFVIYSCTEQELREEHYDELLKYYYEVLSSQISAMGSDPEKLYSWEMFMGEIKKYSYFGLAVSFDRTPILVLDPEDAVDVDIKGDVGWNIDDVWQLGPFKTEEGRRREANNVKFCVDMGYI